MPDDKSAESTTTTGRTAKDAADTTAHNQAGTPTQVGTTTQAGLSTGSPNPGPHNPDEHGTPGATHDTVAQKLENEAAAGQENRY